MNNLSPERWQRVDTLFAEALDWPPEERAAMLWKACGDDPDLYRAVSRLLDEMDAAAHLLGESVTDFAAPLLPELEANLRAEDVSKAKVDRQIGPYRVVRLIGHGGMGTVYLAERADDQYRKEVALKLVRRGMDTQEIVQRFRYERQILASLEHPGIARLYDGGMSADGRPYLVMEYVDGQPIDAYCDAHRLSVMERLELFEAVCEAVQYAHRNTVVHRDLKPSNILVTSDGRVKLLDFGIAKLIAEESTAPAAPRTRTGWRVMTPEYAAPEQVREAPVTTATDVYALGAVLYELLTGRRPLDASTGTTADVEAAILEQRPQRPSAVVVRPVERQHRDGMTVSLTDVSAARSTTPARLRRHLQGDLDVILLKALRKEPERRYASAEALLDDIRRHQMGQPIAARRDSVRYRATKFMRRHRTGVGATLVALLVLIGLGLFHTVRITAERDRARAERDKAEEVSAFLETLFAASDPFRSVPERLDTLRIRDFLDRGTARVERELAGQPLVQAQMFDVIGRVYRNLGLYDEALPPLERAVALRQASASPVNQAESLLHLAILRREQGHYDAADNLLAEALSIYRGAAGPAHSREARVLNEQAIILRERGRYGAAEQRHRRALALLQAAPEDEEELAATVKSSLVTTLENMGAYDRAAPLARDVLAQRRASYGSEHPHVAVALNDLALLLQRNGTYGEAEALIREALVIGRTSLGVDHPLVADMLNRLASVLWWQGRYEEAEPIHRQSLALKRAIYGDAHLQVAISLNNLASLLRDRGNLDGAETMNREAIAITRRLGPDHPGVAITTGNLASTLQAKGNHAQAVELFRQAITAMGRALPADTYRVPLLQRGLGASLTALRRFEEAESVLLNSYRVLRATRGLDDEFAQEALRLLVDLYQAWDRQEQAAPYQALLTEE